MAMDENVSTEIIVRVNGVEFRARDVQMLKQWCADGRVARDSFVLPPGATKWMRAIEYEPLRIVFMPPRPDRVGGVWHIQIGAQTYEAPDYSALKEWYRSGRVPSRALVYHPTMQAWAAASTVPGLDSPVALVLYKINATYRGGIRGFPKESSGAVYLSEDGFDFHGRTLHFDIPFERIISVALDEFRPSAFRVINTQGSVPRVKNVLALTYLDEESVDRTAEFQIHGAITLQGEGEKAAELMNRLLDFKARFARSAGQHTVAAPADPAAQIRGLKALLDEGLLTQEQFERKKQEILARL
jgi:hypothetical protein